MGRVVRVSDTFAGGVPYAVKVLRTPHLKTRFLGEFGLLRRIVHPGFPAAAALRVDRTNGALCAVMSLVEGRTVEDAVDAISPVAFGRFLLHALDHLHRLGVIHGDIAPPNLMVREDGSFVVLDLGASGEVGSGAGSASGLLPYVAPERLAGAPRDAKADLWSAGVTLYRVAHGAHPWPDYPARIPPTFALPSHRDAHPLDPLISRLVDADPKARYKSAGAALRDLEALASEALTDPLPGVDFERAFPYVDVGGALAEVVARLSNARRAALPHWVEVAGVPGSGRTRFLAELADRLAAMDAHVIEVRPLPGDKPGHPLLRALAQAAPEAEGDLPADPKAIARAVLSVLGNAAITLLVDRADAADATTRETLAILRRTFSALPERCGELRVVLAGGEGDVTLQTFGVPDLEALLSSLFPARRFGSRVVDPILERSRGNAKLIRELLSRLIAGGALRADAAALHLDVEAMDALELPPSLAAAAELTLAGLPPAAREVTALLAYSRAPFPRDAFGEEIVALAHLGVASVTAESGRPQVAIASEAYVQAGSALMDPEEAHRRLADRWSSLGETGLAPSLWHRLQVEGEAAASEASQALGRVSPHEALDLLEPLMALGWPRDVEVALQAARLAAKAGGVSTALRLLVQLSSQTDGVQAAKANAMRGRLEARAARHAAAKEAYLEALRVGGDGLDQDLRAEVLAGLSRSAVMMGASEEAAQWATEGMALVDDDAVGIHGRLSYTLGLAAWYSGDLDVANEHLVSSLSHAEAAGDAVEAATVVTAQGLVAHRRGDLSGAVSRYEKALEMGEAIGDDGRILTALQNLGVIHHQEGDWERALDTYREALSYAEAEDQTGRVMQLMANIGNLWRYLGQLPQARIILQRGLELARAEGNRFLQGVLLTNLGEVALMEAASDEAERLLTEAVEAASESERPVEEIEARIDLARLFLELGAHDRAKDALTRVLELTAAGDQEGNAARAHALLAAVEREREGGDLACAAAFISSALSEVEAITNMDVRWPVYLEAARVAQASGDEVEAAQHAERVAQDLRDLEDMVPAAYRESFREVRDRKRAREFTEELTMADISQRKQNAFSDDTWLRLLETNKRLTTETDVRRLLEYIMDSAILLTGAERGFLLLDSDAKAEEVKVDVRVARNIDQENIRNTKLKISRSIATRVIEEGEAIVTVDAMEDNRYRDQLSVHDLKLRSVLCLPMRVRGKVLGAIYLDNRFRAGAFEEGHFRFMEAFADQAGIALHNARLISALEESKRDLEAARKSVEELNEKLKKELAKRTEELKESHRVVIAQQRQLVNRHHYDRIIGESQALTRVFRIMDRLLDNTIPVLISGESGTGKELVARAIHFNGSRAERPFVAINCGAIPANLLESELFGHVRGAFTGATSDKKGLFEAAHLGTLFLDELGELPLEMQVKLLRVLQNGEIKKVGSTKDITVHVRIIAATNRKLDDEVAEGRFREDLFYRLSVVPITIPPLRDRHEDIPLLAQHFIAENANTGLGSVTGISARALSLLQTYGWPGNVRQLEMVLKNVSLFAEGAILDAGDFASFPEIVGGSSGSSQHVGLSGRSLAELERAAIIQALTDHRGNKKRSAEQLGIDRRTLYNKLKAYNIVIEKELHVV